MSLKYRDRPIRIVLVWLLAMGIASCSSAKEVQPKPRILISTDIGGTDDDDFQSMIHLLMYANEVQIEGLVSSPYGDGRKKDILNMIDLFEEDLPNLNKHATGFPQADYLRSITKQGHTASAPYKGFRKSTEGSEWIVKCAKKPSDQPLWILVWGGIDDLAQALHDAPEIVDNIRVYYIGGPNKKWSVNAYAYIAENFPNLWIIEANATYRGWFMDAGSPDNLKANTYYENYIKERGALGKDFVNYYHGHIKMGDTPSLAYVLNGNPDTPLTESWGGSFEPIKHSSRYRFDTNTSINDTVVAYGVIEWNFKGPEIEIPSDSSCFTIEIANQIWPGYYLGKGSYAVRYASKKPETGSYTIESKIEALNGQKGQYQSIAPWPGKLGPKDYKVGDHWYTDRSDPQLFIDEQQGAKTISKHRQAFLTDWAARWKWLE